MNTDYDKELFGVLQKLVYEQLPIKATEIGWEVIGEQVEEAKAKLSALLRRVDRDGRIDELREIQMSDIDDGLKDEIYEEHIKARVAKLKALDIGENNE